jgi:CubicO group peptidase (beta-lactamase class C family)
MKLQDKGIFNVDSSLGYYYPGIDSSDKAGLRIRDILTHQAGLRAWIPFYTSTLEPLDTSQSLFNTNFSYTYPYKMGPAAYANRNIVFKDSIFQSSYSAEYPIHVAKDLYMRPEYRDSIYNKILESPLGEANYLYSDLGYYFLYKTVEYITDTMFYPYTWYNFYAPLGAESMGFLPLNRFEKSMIIPTENDMVFRKQLIQGHVHDPGAAMLGGICGHAGLFSNANDLAKLMQMYLNNGSYGGKKYIDSAIIAEYTRCQFCDLDNRRAMGFDRPMSEEDAGPACNSASERSYGHTGFTGTIAWVDPEYDLIYIFLSNRIQPNQDNTLLISSNVRTRIQEILYKSIEDR